jgi:hypothetical protein
MQYLCKFFGEQPEEMMGTTVAGRFNMIVQSRDPTEIPLTDFECLLFTHQEIVKEYSSLPAFDSPTASYAWAKILGYPVSLSTSNDEACHVFLLTKPRPLQLFSFSYDTKRNQAEVEIWQKDFTETANVILDYVRDRLTSLIPISFGTIVCVRERKKKKNFKNKVYEQL